MLKDTFTSHVVLGYAQLQRHRGLLAPLYCKPVDVQPGQSSHSMILQLCKGVCDKSLVVDDCVEAFMLDKKVRRVVDEIFKAAGWCSYTENICVDPSLRSSHTPTRYVYMRRGGEECMCLCICLCEVG